MGNASSSGDAFPYAVPVDDSDGAPVREDRTSVYRSISYSQELVWQLPGFEIKNGWDCLVYGTNVAGASHDCLGSRMWDSKTEEAKSVGTAPGEMEWITYGRCVELAQGLGTGLQHLDFCPYQTFEGEQYPAAARFRPLGIYSKNRPEWFITSFAADAFGATLVPLYDTLGSSALRFILHQARIGAVAASSECAQTLLNFMVEWNKNLTEDPNVELPIFLKNICLFDRPSPDLAKLAESLGVTLRHWKEIYQLGVENKETNPLTSTTPDEVATICYTSGTTGNPKGVLLTAKNIVACILGDCRGVLSSHLVSLKPSDLHISYLPLAHIFERVIASIMIVKGARIGCFSGDTMKLLDDMKVMMPTIFLSVPRLYMRINDKINSGIKEKSSLAQLLFNTALNSKLSTFRNKGTYTHGMWDALVFGKLKKLMGGNIRFMVAGGAPLDSEIQERMSVIFCCPLLQGFGMTELGASIISFPGDKVCGHIGGIQPCNEMCLEAVDELNYRTTSTPPMGELLIRGHSVTPGYFKNAEATNAAFTEDHFFRTGDIAALLPGGCLKIIDRKKNIFKLAQGEYVAPEKIEMVYTLGCSLVAQIFVHGDPTQCALVAVIVVDEDEAKIYCNENGLGNISMAELCANKAFEKLIGTSLEEAGKTGDLKGFEKVKAFHLESEPFSLENGLLTPTLKLKRPQAEAKYQQILKNLYASIPPQK